MYPVHKSDFAPAPTEQRVVIIGSGHAGVQVADSLRGNGHRGPLVLVGDEACAPYQRPPLSKDHLGMSASAILPLRGEKFFAERDIELLAGVSAVSIDRGARTVSLSDDREVRYDSLVLATGASNRALTLPGCDLTGIHELRTLADADGLRDALSRATSVLIVGSGFIGLEFAAAARARNLPVTVLEMASRPLERSVSVDTAAFLTRFHRDAGIDLRFGESITEFRGRDGAVTGAVSTRGVEYRADLVLIGIGVVPRVTLAEQAGLTVDNGVVVDSCLRTSDKAIYAIGDCANYPDSHAGTRRRLESVQNATDQARHVAALILGDDSSYSAVPWFWSHQGDAKLQIVGVAQPSDEAVIIGDPAAQRFSVCRLRDGNLVAVESINRPADHMAARRLLAQGPVPAPPALRDPAFDLKRFAQELAAAR